MKSLLLFFAPAPLFCFSIPERDLHQRYRVGIVLLLAFELQQIVVGAAFGDGKLSAHRRPRVIDPAASRFRVDKLASLAEQRVTLAAQHSFLLVHLCITRCRHFFRNVEVFRQTTNVARRYLNALVHRATECRAINAVVRTLRLWLTVPVTHDRS